MKTHLYRLALLCSLLASTLQLTAQVITTIAGTGTRGFSGDGGPAVFAQLDQPYSIAVDDSGNVYIIDLGKDNISKIAADNTITTIAGNSHYQTYSGNPPYGFVKEGVPAISALVWKPFGIVADHKGNVYYTEYENAAIRKIDANGIVNTIAGIPGKIGFGFVGADNKATTNMINKPADITADDAGNLYFADEENNLVRKITPYGTISTVAGTGYDGYSGDGGIATAARLDKPSGVAVDDNGNIFIADANNNAIRKVNKDGVITTYAGTGRAGYTGDGGPAVKARLNTMKGIAVDYMSNLYITDIKDHVIRKVDTKGIITTFAGNGQKGYSGDDGLPTQASLNMPSDVAVDNDGNVYIADDQNHVIRKVNINESPKPEHLINDAVIVSADLDKSELTIKTDTAAYTSFTITDFTKKVLIQHAITTNETTVNVSTLPSGHYFINLKKDEKVKTVTFVKSD